MLVKKYLTLTLALILVSGCSAHQPKEESQKITVSDHSQQEVYQAHLDDKGQVQKSESKALKEENKQANSDSASQEDEKNKGQKLLSQAQKEYEAGHYDAAAGSLSSLEKEEEWPEEAETLRQQVQQAQVQQEKEKPAESKEYQLERQSKIAADEYYEATQEDIQTASDHEIENWKADTSVQTDKEPAKESDLLNHLIQVLAIDPSDYDFIIQDESGDSILVEIRQSQATADVEVSNLIGIFKLDKASEAVQKLNLVSGEFEDY